jgi:hypothetical protein
MIEPNKTTVLAIPMKFSNFNMSITNFLNRNKSVQGIPQIIKPKTRPYTLEILYWVLYLK